MGKSINHDPTELSQAPEMESWHLGSLGRARRLYSRIEQIFYRAVHEVYLYWDHLSNIYEFPSECSPARRKLHPRSRLPRTTGYVAG